MEKSETINILVDLFDDDQLQGFPVIDEIIDECSNADEIEARYAEIEKAGLRQLVKTDIFSLYEKKERHI